MRLLNFLIFFVVSVLSPEFVRSASAVKPGCEHDDSTFRCVKVIRNYDGDTLTAEIPGLHPLLGSKIPVRVLGIDTPELRGKAPCEKEVAKIARNLVENVVRRAENVELRKVQRDKYFRILAEVYVDGQNLKDLLIKNRLAYAYDGGTKEKFDWCPSLRSPSSVK